MADQTSAADSGKSEIVGKVVFTATFIAMMVFFWWLLIYDHGVVSMHH